MAKLELFEDSLEGDETGIALHYDGTADELRFEDYGLGTLNESIMTLERTGMVGIGTTSPDYPLHVDGAICGTSYCEPSDARLKTRVQTMEDGLATLLSLRPVRFDWRKDGGTQRASKSGRQIGFIAQEVDEVVPEIVNQGADGYYAPSTTEN